MKFAAALLLTACVETGNVYNRRSVQAVVPLECLAISARQVPAIGEIDRWPNAISWTARDGGHGWAGMEGASLALVAGESRTHPCLTVAEQRKHREILDALQARIRANCGLPDDGEIREQIPDTCR
jgi:hypothetical protein